MKINDSMLMAFILTISTSVLSCLIYPQPVHADTSISSSKQPFIERLGTVLADKGYYSGPDIKATQDAGMTPLVPKGDTSGSKKKGIFNRSLFKYDPEKDVYICPANQTLPHRLTGVEHGMTIRRYFLDVFTCRACEKKSQYTKSKEPRRIARWEHQNQLD